MSYVLTDFNVYAGRGFNNNPSAVYTKERAYTFNSKKDAENYLKSIPKEIKKYKWKIFNLDERIDVAMAPEVKKFGNPTKTTILEEKDFDITEFFQP